jgi:transposase
MGKLRSWEVSDELWAKVEPFVPAVTVRDEKRTYQRRSGGGRKPMAARQAFAAMVFVLRTGIQWKALPKEKFGSSSAVHRRFIDWQKAGFFLKLWQAGLAEYEDMEGIAWRWQSVDGAMTKAPLGQQSVGANPTDRGKKRPQAQSARRRAWGPAVARRLRSQHS